MTRTGCRCGHGWTAHDHYREGSECSACSCARYRRPLWWRIVTAVAP